MNSFHVKRQDVETIIRMTFPSYNGKSFCIRVQDSYTLENYWSGGSREQPKFLLNNNGQVKVYDAPGKTGNPFLPDAHKSVTIPKNGMIAVHSIFCGKDIGIFFYVSTDSEFLPKMLPVTDNTLTFEEKVVLHSTRSYKNSYAGMNDCRFREAKQATGISLESWNAAVDSCKAKGYLNKAGAITMEGKNIDPGSSFFPKREA